MKKRIIYGESNYASFVRKNGYFVDKTEYIAKLESIENPIFLRPRRFGKSIAFDEKMLVEKFNMMQFFDGSLGMLNVPIPPAKAT